MRGSDGRALRESLRVVALVLALATALGPAVANASSPDLEVQGDLKEGGDVSGIAAYGDLLLVVSDEGAELQVLRRTGEGKYAVEPDRSTPLGPAGSEADLEGIALHGDTLFAVCSHSAKRKKIDADKSQQKNRKRTQEVEPELERGCLFRVELDPDTGRPKSDVEKENLTDRLKSDPILSKFVGIPSKENGIDIEAIGVRGDELYVGFRGPVLRENLVPVLVTKWKKPDESELRFVTLDGLGIRDLVAVEDGFLVLAGPVGDGAGDHAVYFWSGADEMPGTDAPPQKAKQLAAIPQEGDAIAEGLTVESEDGDCWNAILAFDGAKNGGLRKQRFCRS